MKNTKLWNLQSLTLGIFTATTLAFSFAVQGGELDVLQQKIEQLSTTSQKNNEDVAKAMNVMTQIQQDFQSIRGEVEASKYLTKESDKTYEDLSLRVTTLEDKIEQIRQLMQELVKNSTPSSASTPAPAPNETTGGTQALVSPAKSGEYDEFQGLMQKVNAQDFSGAVTGLTSFLQKYPQSEFAGSAQFWIAESQFSLGDFAKAIQEYQIFSEKYPSHPRIREAVYQQGQAFARLKKYEEAKLFFQKVISTYPNSAEAAKAQARLHQIQELEKRGQLPATAVTPTANPAEKNPASVKAPTTTKTTSAPKPTSTRPTAPRPAAPKPR